MCALIDADTILSKREEWMKLEEEWGDPIDLDTEDDHTPMLKSVFSTLDLKGTTFDSSFLFKKVRRKVGRKLSKRSASSFLDYKDFINDLRSDAMRESSKQFYFVNGQIMSAVSVEEICEKIDGYFKSIEKLAITSTIRKKIPELPELVKCSISSNDLSFDDTVVDVSRPEKGDSTEKGKSTQKSHSTEIGKSTQKSHSTEIGNSTEVNMYIDQAFEEFNSTVATIEDMDQSTRDSVTTLVRKFSSILKSPSVNCSPRRKRQCSDRFRDLAEFWKKRSMEVDKIHR